VFLQLNKRDNKPVGTTKTVSKGCSYNVMTNDDFENCNKRTIKSIL
jgi:hypothetical protein